MPQTHHRPAVGSEPQCPRSGIQTNRVTSFQNILSPCGKRKRDHDESHTGSEGFCWRSLMLTLQWPKQVPRQHLPSTRPRSQSYHVPEKRLRNIWYLAPMMLDSCRHFTLSWARMSKFTINAHRCTFTQQSLLMLSSFFCLISHWIWRKHH